MAEPLKFADGAQVRFCRRRGFDMTNTWPGGKRHAMYQSEHEQWNSNNYPGTRQICVICGLPTGRCEDDTIWTVDGEPICWDCSQEHPELLEK
jgi:hypothetical protein